MLSRVFSAAVHGINGYPLTVEVDFRPGLPVFSIVGLPDASVRESRERVIAALKNSGFAFQPHRITVNLAPGHIKKEGPAFDFPIAVGVLAAAELIPMESLGKWAFLGELGLDGSLRPVRGVLPCVLGLKKKGFRGLFLPKKNSVEAAIVDGIDIFPMDNLQEAVACLTGENVPVPFHIDRSQVFNQSLSYNVDFSDVKGQAFAKRALEVAAAGGHNILLLWTQNYLSN